MANCGKCQAELIGSAKFCATCGAPVPSAPAGVSPAASSSSQLGGAAVDAGGYAPPSLVNPFAATASPSSPSISKRASAGAIAAAEPAAETRAPSVPPPATSGSRPPMGIDSPSQVSPLAVSNAISDRNVFQQAVEEAARAKQASVAPPTTSAASPEPSAAKSKKPGTQLMAAAPARPPSAAKPAEPLEPAKPAPKGKTVAMPFNAAAMMMSKAQTGGGAGGSVAPSGPQPAAAAVPQSVGYPGGAQGMPQSVLQPSTPQAPQSVLQPSTPYAPAPQSVGYPPATSQQPPPAMYGQQQPAAYGQAAPQQPPPAGPGGWGWAPQPAAPQPPAQPPPMAGGYGYGGGGYGFPPGSRVHVTWSNGQRYPATVGQVSGTQCLVVFPDGQQHWVEMQFLSPG